MTTQSNTRVTASGVKTPRYLVAKYIPDVQRLEPRNVGVVVWSPEGITGSFLGEKAQTGSVDGRSLPGWIKSPTTYKQWVGYWRGIVDGGFVEDDQGSPVPFDDERFLPTILSRNKRNYCLVEGGFLLDRLSKSDLPDLTASLYRKLVFTEEPQPRASVESQIEMLLEEAHLASNPHLHRQFTVSCRPPAGPPQDFTFSYAYKNGTLRQLYERVSLSNWQRQRSVNAAAWKFQKVVEAGLVKQDQTAALILVPPLEAQKPSLRQSIEVLESVTRVINVAEEEQARHEFEKLSHAVSHT